MVAGTRLSLKCPTGRIDQAMKHTRNTLIAVLCLLLASTAYAKDRPKAGAKRPAKPNAEAKKAPADAAPQGRITVAVDGRKLVGYQAKPLSKPNGGDKFKGSNFIHPLKTPSGFTLTAANPRSHHHHHFGLWWPW